MIEEPRTEQRPARPYVAVRRTVSHDGFPAAIDSALPRLFGWLEASGVDPAGAPMIRYRGESADGYDVDLAVPVASPAAEVGSGLTTDELPAGSYAVVTHFGPYEHLAEGHGVVDAWIAEADLTQDDAAGARVEVYVTDPRNEPDPTRVRVDVEQLLL